MSRDGRSGLEMDRQIRKREDLLGVEYVIGSTRVALPA